MAAKPSVIEVLKARFPEPAAGAPNPNTYLSHDVLLNALAEWAWEQEEAKANEQQEKDAQQVILTPPAENNNIENNPALIPAAPSFQDQFSGPLLAWYTAFMAYFTKESAAQKAQIDALEKRLAAEITKNEAREKWAAETNRTLEFFKQEIHALKKESLFGNPRDQVNWAAYDLNERILKVQIYNHIEILIAFRMAFPLTMTGIMMFVIEASLGDINFKSEEVQTTLGVGLFASFFGVLGAAYFIKSILHGSWVADVDSAFKRYQSKLDEFLEDKIDCTPDQTLYDLMEKNVTYAKGNWFPHGDADELNWVGFRKNALHGDETDSKEVDAHNDRRYVSKTWIIMLNLGALICGVFLAGIAHEKKRNIPEKPDLDFSSSTSHEHSHNFLGDMFGSEWAAIGSLSILLFGIAMSVGYTAMRCYQTNAKVVKFTEMKKNIINPNRPALSASMSGVSR